MHHSLDRILIVVESSRETLVWWFLLKKSHADCITKILNFHFKGSINLVGPSYSDGGPQSVSFRQSITRFRMIRSLPLWHGGERFMFVYRENELFEVEDEWVRTWRGAVGLVECSAFECFRRLVRSRRQINKLWRRRCNYVSRSYDKDDDYDKVNAATRTIFDPSGKKQTPKSSRAKIIYLKKHIS